MHDGPHSAYAEHDLLLAEARRYPEIWRLLAGLAVVAGVFLVLNLVFFALIQTVAPPNVAASLTQGTSIPAMLLLLFNFVFVTLGVAIAARRLQHRSLGSLIGARARTLAQFWRVMCALPVLAGGLLLLPPYGVGEPLVQNLPFGRWILVLPFSLCAVLIQTSAEEILFRGYIQQALAVRFKSPIIWMGAPSLLFAAGHYAPMSAGENAGLIAFWACIFGLLAADLTARSGTLGPAIALHFFNNCIALLFVSLPDNLSGLSLFLLPYDLSETAAVRQWLIVDLAAMLVFWLAARLAIRR